MGCLGGVKTKIFKKEGISESMIHNYMVVFIVHGFEDLSPALKIGDRGVTYITDVGEYARHVLKTEMGEAFNKLWGSSGLPCIQIDVQAEDEDSAIKKAWGPAKRIVNALSLVEFEQQNAISMDYRNSPNLLPNILVANLDEATPTLDVGYYIPKGLIRFSVGKLREKAREFNNKVVRHIEKLMPPELWLYEKGDDEVTKRLAHSLQWYSVAMNQQEIEFRFIAMWFGLESMVIESIKTGHKRQKLKDRLGKLYFKHNSEELEPSSIEKLWSLRTDIVHEALSGFFERGGGLVSAGHINNIKYLYFIVILFVLDMLPNNYSLSLMWKNLATYKPSMNTKISDVPLYLDVLDMFRYSQ